MINAKDSGQQFVDFDQARKFFIECVAVQPAPSQVYIPAVVAADLLHGVERASAMHKVKSLHFVDSILLRIPVIDYTISTARIHAILCAELERKGKMIGYYGLMIAATAIEHSATVVTINKKHFSAIPGLKFLVP